MQKEQRYDDLDREEEKEELAEAAKKAAQEVEAAAAAVANAAAEASAAMEVDSAALAIPSASQDKDVEMNDPSGSGSISTTTDGAERNLLDIPSDPQELWNWPVQWSVMEANDGLILKEKIMPFATKIVVELLGVPEEDLTKYVVDHIRQRKPPQDLVSELRGVSAFFFDVCYCIGLLGEMRR